MIFESAARLASRIEAGELTPLEAVDMYIDRIEFVNPRLNAIVATRFEQARDEAKKAASVSKKSRGRLFGVPISIKEMISVEGMPVTAGSARRKDAVANRDATVVRRLRDEGAIVLGVTNQSELGLWWESNNPVYGRTKNPHNLGRTSGGSSGGEAAIIAAAGTAAGIGSDMGGSVRLPAMFCGIYGHKPSGGLVPTSGHFPVEHSDHRIENPPSARLIALGPLARYPEDLQLLFETIRGPCDEDENSRRAKSYTNGKVQRAFVMTAPSISKASTTSRAQQNAALLAGEILASNGVKVTELDPRFFIDAFDIYAGTLSAMEGALEFVISGESGMSLVREATRFARRSSPHTAPAWLAVFGERILRPSANAVQKAATMRRAMLQKLNELLGEDGILVMPTFPSTAPRHQTTLLKPFDISYTAIFNALELPVTAAPISIASDGLPTGVQLVAGMDRDAVSLHAATLLHEATGGAVPPVVQ